jgi:hypothetical protein
MQLDGMPATAIFQLRMLHAVDTRIAMAIRKRLRPRLSQTLTSDSAATEHLQTYLANMAVLQYTT